MKDPENSHKGKANRLIEESSPYLLQHAYNPVDWYPWKKEALDKAKRENKLMIISIGYAACHWCHVMERESFEDTVVAQKMNANYVSIKIDREERPDIDQIYMDAAMLINGRGGWPYLYGNFRGLSYSLVHCKREAGWKMLKKLL